MPIAAESLRLGPWRAGVNYSLPAEEIGPEGLYDMANCTVGQAGEVKKRKGYAKYNASALNSGATVTALGQLVLAGTEKVFVIAGNKFYDVTGGTATDRTGSVTITAGNDNVWNWVLAGDTLVAVNGVDTDGITWAGGTNNAGTLDDDSRFTKPTWIAFWENRLWLGNENSNNDRVWRSDAGDITTWGATNYHQFGYEVHGLSPFGNALAVHTEQGIHTLTPTGNSTIPFQQQQQTQQGTIAGRSIVNIPGQRQLFVREDGIYQWAGGTQVEKMSFALDDRYWDDINTARLAYSFALYYPNKEEVWFFLPHGAGQSTMDSVVVYSTRLACWFGPYDNFTRDSAALIDDLPHAGDFDGYIMKHETGNNDDGDLIKGYFETGNIAPLGDSVECRWLYARTLFDNQGDYDVAVQQKAAGIVANVATLTMEHTGSTAAFGLLDSTFVLDTSTLQPELSTLTGDTDLFGYDPRTMLRFSNFVDDETFTIRRTSLMYKPIGRTRHRRTGLE